MALLKRLSYFCDNLNTTEKDYQLYLLRARPLRECETQKERNKKIKKLKNEKICKNKN